MTVIYAGANLLEGGFTNGTGISLAVEERVVLTLNKIVLVLNAFVKFSLQQLLSFLRVEILPRDTCVIRRALPTPRSYSTSIVLVLIELRSHLCFLALSASLGLRIILAEPTPKQKAPINQNWNSLLVVETASTDVALWLILK